MEIENKSENIENLEYSENTENFDNDENSEDNESSDNAENKANKDLIRHIARLIADNKKLSQQLKTTQEAYNKTLEENQILKDEIEDLKHDVKRIKTEACEETILRFKMVTVAFADIQGFSKVFDEENAHGIMDELDDIFIAFEEITKKHNIERIKTIGDTYMCAGGIPVKNITNPIDVVLAALEMRHYLYEAQMKRSGDNKQIWEVRIGLHTGAVTSTTMGKKKISYSIKGDTVNIASRMQAASRSGQINISVMTYELVKEYFECDYFGIMPVKYQGDVEMYIVKGLKPRFSDTGNLVFPNHKFKIKYLLRQFADIQEIILDKLEKELPKYLYYHNVKHTIDVVSQVELIGIGEGVDEDNMLLLKTAGLFHDVGFTVGYDEHEKLGAEVAKQFLPLYKYTQEQIEKICSLILATRLPPQPNTLLERIMCDSDLDYLGRSDFIPVSNTLYEELKYQNKIGTINDWNKLQVKFISNHQYFTDTANKFREVKKQMQIERIKSLIEE